MTSQDGVFVMAAVNGARLTKQQCPAVPITIGETAQAAKECYAAGAKAVHAHIRDKDGGHLLDAGAYRELIDEIKTRAPEMMVQITTESGGKYAPHQQRSIARQTAHNEISAALREITADNDDKAAAAFYHWAARGGVRIQHILYCGDDARRLAALIKGGIIPAGDLFVLFVLGDYQTRAATPDDMLPFLAAMRESGLTAQTMACAFGRGEGECLLAAAKAGAHCRVGLENNHHNDDGSPANNNAERVAQLVKMLQNAGISPSLPC